MVQVLGMTLEEALPYMTCQVAEGLDLLGIKGTVQRGPMRICCCLIRI